MLEKGYSKKLRYSPYWSLDQLLDFLKINDNFNYISERLQNSEILETFLENAKKLEIIYLQIMIMI